MDPENRGEIITVRIGAIEVASPPIRLSAVGLGSCVAVVIRDSGKGVGGMAHAMLPWLPEKPRAGANLLKYADYAIDYMVEEILGNGGSRASLEAKLVGGAHMFSGPKGESPINVGQRNLEAARRKLAQMEIPIFSEDSGGNHGRSVLVDLADGSVRIRSLRKGSLVI
jgi:chemotaxis protein CheD